ncbi:MAG: hypothetical protein ACXWQ6_07305, partial [Candidatus Limnocylindrales bacterium]
MAPPPSFEDGYDLDDRLYAYGSGGGGGAVQQHMAMPRLLGAPAYARPPAAVAIARRPFDPDELPIEA